MIRLTASRRYARYDTPPLDDTDAWREYILNNSIVTDSGCWEWQRGRSHGYGYVDIRRQRYRLHRLSHELFNGEVPGNLFVCHRCDNPPCCNPEHLFLGTQADNMRDAANKCRIPRGHAASLTHRGVLNGHCKLTEEQVLEIRSLRGTASQKSIGERFGISQHAVSQIHRRKLWKHLPEEI